MRKGKLRRLLIRSVPMETARLVLRNINASDANDMYAYASRPEVTEYLLWDAHANISVTRGYIESVDRRYRRGLYGDWAVVLKETGRMIGTCGYANVDSQNMKCEIGYVLSPDYRGKGYMTEAVNAVLMLSFEKLGFESAELRIMQGNSRSAALAERTGFTLERVCKDEITVRDIPRTLMHYCLTKEQYFAKKV
ncbi:MAG: GNAT family N-acetyltransferase [Clostridia bacterium]|nr:GNAT family N-acetyltransferase [Clostridia bacterium]